MSYYVLFSCSCLVYFFCLPILFVIDSDNSWPVFISYCYFLMKGVLFTSLLANLMERISSVSFAFVLQYSGRPSLPPMPGSPSVSRFQFSIIFPSNYESRVCQLRHGNFLNGEICNTKMAISNVIALEMQKSMSVLNTKFNVTTAFLSKLMTNENRWM